MNSYPRFLAIGTIAVVVVVTSIQLYGRREHDAQPIARAEPGTIEGAAATAHRNGKAVSDDQVQLKKRIVSAQQRSNWAKQWESSTDNYDFISNAVKAAYNGDGRAAFYIYKALLKCQGFVTRYGASNDPHGQFYLQEVANTKAPQWFTAKRENEFRQCSRMIKENVFADLPIRPDGYTARYWRDQALAEGDDLATTDRAAGDIAKAVGLPMSAEKQSITASAQDDMNEALLSKDPEVLYLAGQILANGQLSTDPLRGFAVQLAACDLGYDCSSDNPDNLFSICKDSNLCTAGTDLSNHLQQMLGPEKYAVVYAKAQEFKALLAADDSTGVLQFSRLDSISGNIAAVEP